MPSVVSAVTFSGCFACASLMVGQLLFGGGENHRDRLDLGDGHDAGLRRGIDDVADVDLTQAGDAGDRRLDAGVIELGLGVEDRRVVGRDLRGELGHGGALGVGLLPGREFAEFCEALQVQIGVGEVGLVLLLLGLGLVERGLERAGIDLHQQVALFHQVAFLERDLVDLAIDPGAHHHGVKTLHGAESGQQHRKIGLLDGGDGHRNSGVARRGRLLRAVSLRRLVRAVKSLPAEIARCHQRGSQQDPTHRPRPGHVNSTGFKNK